MIIFQNSKHNLGSANSDNNLSIAKTVLSLFLRVLITILYAIFLGINHWRIQKIYIWIGFSFLTYILAAIYHQFVSSPSAVTQAQANATNLIFKSMMKVITKKQKSIDSNNQPQTISYPSTLTWHLIILINIFIIVITLNVSSSLHVVEINTFILSFPMNLNFIQSLLTIAFFIKNPIFYSVRQLYQYGYSHCSFFYAYFIMVFLGSVMDMICFQSLQEPDIPQSNTKTICFYLLGGLVCLTFLLDYLRTLEWIKALKQVANAQ